MTDWVRKMVDLSPQWVGVISDTASTSTLVAMISARERTTDYGLAKGGLQAEAAPLVVYASAGSHSCVEKGALLAGFGCENVRMVPLDGRHGMRPEALRELIEQDLAAGLRPCAIAACVGGTATASIDPIREIADIACRYGLWLHVDAAMAGSAMILPECRWMWDGIEGADSVVINAHKWLDAPFDCSLYYVRDEQLARVMSTNPSFLQSSVDSQVRNLCDTGIPLDRRFRALKLWFLIREQGVSGLQTRLRRDMANARRLAEIVSATPDWKVVAPVHLQTVCVRYEPDGLAGGAALDAYTRAWADAVNGSGAGYLTPATVDGRWMVRISIGAPTTEWADVEAIWAAIQQHASASLKRAESPPPSLKVAGG